jgi:diadenosine tetraphosphate (Ap4A) HIT family hydrolase
MNPTMRKFGWPETMLRQWDHWVVLARPSQATLGSLVLAAKSDATAFSDLPPAAHAELAPVIKAIERAMREAANYAKINYLMLMMVDNEVHFHVIPRYDGFRNWKQYKFVDSGWPRLPALDDAVTLEGAELDAFVEWLKRFFDEVTITASNNAPAMPAGS